MWAVLRRRRRLSRPQVTDDYQPHFHLNNTTDWPYLHVCCRHICTWIWPIVRPSAAVCCHVCFIDSFFSFNQKRWVLMSCYFRVFVVFSPLISFTWSWLSSSVFSLFTGLLFECHLYFLGCRCFPPACFFSFCHLHSFLFKLAFWVLSFIYSLFFFPQSARWHLLPFIVALETPGPDTVKEYVFRQQMKRTVSIIHHYLPFCSVHSLKLPVKMQIGSFPPHWITFSIYLSLILQFGSEVNLIWYIYLKSLISKCHDNSNCYWQRGNRIVSAGYWQIRGWHSLRF